MRNLEIPAAVLLAAFILVFATYQLGMLHSLSSDDWVYIVNPQGIPNQHSATARPLSGLLQWLWNFTGINIIAIQPLTALVSITLLASAIAALYSSLLRSRSFPVARPLIFAACYLIVCNPFVAEWFTYSYITPFNCLSQLLAVGAAILLARPTISRPVGICVFLLAIAGASLFQSPLSLSVPLAIALLALNRARPKLIVRRSMLGLAAWASGGLFCLLYVRLVHPLFSHLIDARTARLDLGVSLYAVMASQRDLWVRSLNMLPPNLFIVLILAGAALLIFGRGTRSYRSLILVSAALLPALALGPHVITAVVWIVPRSVTSIGAIPGILLLGATWEAPANRVRTWVLTGFAAAMILITIGACNRILADFVASYRQDRQEALLMWDQIARAERATGIPVTRVAFTLDRAPLWCYPDVRCYGDLNVRAWVRGWARVYILDEVTGRRFTEIPFTGTLINVFGTDNWNAFSAEQVRVSGDTAYIAIY